MTSDPSEPYDVVLAEAEPTGVVGDFFISKPREPFMRHIVSGLCAAKHHYILPYVTVMLSTGPWYLSAQLWAYRRKTHSSVEDRYNDTHPNTSRIRIIASKTYNGGIFQHMAGASWQSWDGRLIWWLSRYIPNHLVTFVLLLSLSVLVLSLLVTRRQLV